MLKAHQYHRKSRFYKAVLLFAFLSFLGFGCNNQLFPDSFISLNPKEHFSPTPTDSVQLYITQLPSRPYQEIGILYVRTRNNNSDTENKNLVILKKMAANYGANAVIRLDVTDFNIKGVAVRWK
ncbi:hypothetical protein QM480_15435 [Flectobacillus sp. DC10W]|uniref:Uncharacterized protein n=1 Tax=Flectobacillus longus TaxID=2984207 RepID=A0ABT6YRD3_9BACT|nr:hypothetical protein [Flectobacillus longus]MDI9865736.1 hypothetical protein [Flectobacillus longus]